MAGLIVMLVYVSIFLIFLFLIFFAIRYKTTGKILAFFVDRDKVLSYRLFKPNGRWFKLKADDDESYHIDTECVLLVRYPFGGMIPAFLQQVIPCLVYAKNNTQPLNPNNITQLPKGMTSKEVALTTSENVIRGIVRGVDEDTKPYGKLPPWLLPGLCILLILVLALMMFAMNGKLDEALALQKMASPLPKVK